MDRNQVVTVILYCCPVSTCTKEFKNRFILKRHFQSVHLKIKQFACKTCGKEFVSKKNLSEHRFIHSGTKPYKCSFCGKKFRHASHLCLHKRIHKTNYKQTYENLLKIEKQEDLVN